MEINSRIRQIRIARGYSQDFMAIQLDISQKTYSRLETCEKKISVEILRKIAKILHVELSDFFDDKWKDNDNNRFRGELNISAEEIIPLLRTFSKYKLIISIEASNP